MMYRYNRDFYFSPVTDVTQKRSPYRVACVLGINGFAGSAPETESPFGWCKPKRESDTHRRVLLGLQNTMCVLSSLICSSLSTV